MIEDTIVALLTPKGKGAVSVLRISGDKALEFSKRIAPFLPLNPHTHRSYVGVLKYNRQVLDKALITYFAKGKSFTGEESVEISCHGGEVYGDILEVLLSLGVRMAKRGEFSFRACCNGKIDLVQAEAILQLIESQNKLARRHAFSQLQGELSKKIRKIEKKWLFVLSHIEADIDFSLENLSTYDTKDLHHALLELQTDLLSLVSCYRPYKNIQKGLHFGIFGPVNSGKSSLFNAILGQSKAIVSKEKGTTRDIIEGQIMSSSGLNVSLYDSAGFRVSQSEGEKIGQKKAKDLFNSCDYKIVVIDCLKWKSVFKEKWLFSDPLNTILVFSKQDLSLHKTLITDVLGYFNKKRLLLPKKNQIFFVSSLTGNGIQKLKRKIISYTKTYQDAFLFSNYRHYQLLIEMNQSLKRGLCIVTQMQVERDILALELREGLHCIYEILGKNINDNLLDTIFKEFCIGK